MVPSPLYSATRSTGVTRPTLAAQPEAQIKIAYEWYARPGAHHYLGRTVIRTAALVVTAPELSRARTLSAWVPVGTLCQRYE
jgi:hypothetical protein